MLIRVTILFFLLPGCIHAQWQLLTTSGQTLHAVYFLDLPGPPRIGFIGGDGGGEVPSTIEKTTDGGRTWKYVTNNGGNYTFILDFSFKDSMTGFAAVQQDGPGCLKTTDGGETWNPCHYYNYANGVYYNAGNGGLFLSSDAGLSISWDEGETWSEIQNSIYDERFGFAFSDANHGITTSWYVDDPWSETTDGGKTWQYLSVDSTGWQPLAIQGTNTFFELTIFGPYLVRTNDGGDSIQTIHFFPNERGLGTWGGGTTDPKIDSLCSPGCIRGDLSRLFVQLYSGLYESTDTGVNWKYLCGQPFRVQVNSYSAVEFIRFFVSGQYVYAITADTSTYGFNCLWMLDLDSLNLSSFNISEQFPDGSKRIGVSAGSDVTVNYVPLTDTLVGIDSVMLAIHYDSASLLLNGINIPSPWGILDSSLRGNVLYLLLTDTSAEPLPSPILQLTFSTFLNGDDHPLPPTSSGGSSAKVYLDSVHLYGHRLNCDCAVQSILNVDTSSLASSIDSVEIDFTGCEDSILLAAMQGKPPFSIESIQPNPAQSSIHVLLSKAVLSAVTAELYDILGTQVLSQNEPGTDFTLDLTAIAAGSYYLRLSQESETETRRIEVIK